MQLSLIAWISSRSDQQLSLLDWIEAEEIAKLVESKLTEACQ